MTSAELCAWMQERHLTPKQIAFALNVSVTNVYYWRNGRRGGPPRYVGHALNWIYYHTNRLGVHPCRNLLEATDSSTRH